MYASERSQHCACNSIYESLLSRMLVGRCLVLEPSTVSVLAIHPLNGVLSLRAKGGRGSACGHCMTSQNDHSRLNVCGSSQRLNGLLLFGKAWGGAKNAGALEEHDNLGTLSPHRWPISQWTVGPTIHVVIVLATRLIHKKLERCGLTWSACGTRCHIYSGGMWFESAELIAAIW